MTRLRHLLTATRGLAWLVVACWRHRRHQRVMVGCAICVLGGRA